MGSRYSPDIPYVTAVRCYDIPCSGSRDPKEDEEDEDEEDEDEEDEDWVQTEPNAVKVSLDSVYPCLYNER
ncbi:hypothetical protein E8E12_004531 [Didymella heteroderae]|uniref:Uncharacterized protein n=1 Tax=Didymella heteroderae TaxID=1769908 RepID=A0A9P4WV26_9PLEO|nr:hypothetical protein E8E12_004531 [Didymella heteroderae]